MSSNSVYPIIYFDGVCVLCNNFVLFVLKRDKNNVFKFSTVQEFDKQEMRSNKIAQKDTIILDDNGHVFEESDAVIRIVRKLGGVWKLARVFQFVPRFLRDGLYRWIARNRFRIFGRTEYCSVMTPEIKDKFLNMN